MKLAASRESFLAAQLNVNIIIADRSHEFISADPRVHPKTVAAEVSWGLRLHRDTTFTRLFCHYVFNRTGCETPSAHAFWWSKLP